jgi:hypothetical protein
VPSPVGHALGGLAAGWIVAGGLGVGSGRPAWRRAIGFAAAGTLADLDLLVGLHSQYSHSVGAVAAVFVIAAVLARHQPRWAVLAAATAAAYGSHLLLDWLGQDGTPPFGLTALWPLSGSYFLSHLDLFRGISREVWRPDALAHDLRAVTREILVLAPLCLGAWWLSRLPGRDPACPYADSTACRSSGNGNGRHPSSVEAARRKS